MAIETVSSFPVDLLRENYFAYLDKFTPMAINQKIKDFKDRLAADTERPFVVSLGENCGPAIKLKGAHVPGWTSGFFDNLVCPLSATEQLLRTDFAELLRLRNLGVSTWEGQDSVYDKKHGIFFHHYFSPGPQHLEKTHPTEGTWRRRRIDETDIPLFFPAVSAQFEYLAEKFRLICRAPNKTVLVFRTVSGKPLSTGATDSLAESLTAFGAVNFKLAVVHSQPLEESSKAAIHHLIVEHEDRWGSTDEWSATINRQT